MVGTPMYYVIVGAALVVFIALFIYMKKKQNG